VEGKPMMMHEMLLERKNLKMRIKTETMKNLEEEHEKLLSEKLQMNHLLLPDRRRILIRDSLSKRGDYSFVLRVCR